MEGPYILKQDFESAICSKQSQISKSTWNGQCPVKRLKILGGDNGEKCKKKHSTMLNETSRLNA